MLLGRERYCERKVSYPRPWLGAEPVPFDFETGTITITPPFLLPASFKIACKIMEDK